MTEPRTDSDTNRRRTSAPTWARRGLAFAFGLVFAVGFAELLLRTLVGPPRVLGKPYFRDEHGAPIEVERGAELAQKRGVFEAVPADQTPRPRFRFAPGSRFSMCYEDADRLRPEGLDARGCIDVRINRFGLRERDEIAPDNKRPDERRIVCIGDSFTFGWGVPVERGWVRMLEDDLRRTHGDVRTVNCGMSGALTVDEYWWGLRSRFGEFQPDVVLVSICLNDLMASFGLCIYDPAAQPAPTGFLLLDYVRQAAAGDPMQLDPRGDWVKLALSLPEAEGTAMGVYGPDKPFAGMWSQGAPQAALVAMRDWAASRKAVLLVTLWPFLQGLGPTEQYPFRTMHDLVADFCLDEGIPFLDLEPALAAAPAASLWVTPFDKHANPRAHAMALPAIAEFVRANWPFAVR